MFCDRKVNSLLKCISSTFPCSRMTLLVRSLCNMLQAMCLSWLPGREGVKKLLPFYTISRVISTTMMWALFATTIISFNFPEVSMGYKILPAVLWSTGILCEFLVTPWLSARGYEWPVHMGIALYSYCGDNWTRPLFFPSDNLWTF